MACPIVVEEGQAGLAGIDHSTPLVMPDARSALLQKSHQSDGAPLLTLYVGTKEVTFDDPEEFAFAQELIRTAPFLAGDAADWGNVGWPKASAMLEALLEEGIIRLARGEMREDRHDNKVMPSPLPTAPMTRPRSWIDADSLMAHLTGTALDPAYLELVVPIFRTGHVFLDRDGRQVGEANVFPASARLNIATDWRGCPYAGNRYQADKPMNVTALRAMRVHWRQIMALAAQMRARYLVRFPQAQSGWTVGDVERLAVCALALPSYMMLRCDAPVANGDLHPALSNLFRVTDGLRMVMHQMLFLPLYEKMMLPDVPITPAEILDYADRNYSFHSDHGVCAGPRFMIEDMLAVLLDGAAPRGGFDANLDAELAPVLNLIEPAIDYAMLGLQAYGAVFSLWPAMTRAYEHLHLSLGGKEDAGGSRAREIAQRFEAHFAALNHRSFLANEEWRAHREAVYDDMFARCHAAVSRSAPPESLSAMLAPDASVCGGRAQDVLAAAVAAHLGYGGGKIAENFAAIVMGFLARGQRIVALAERIQRDTAALLHRPAPSHRLTLRHLNLHNVLMGEDVRTVPFLPDELARLFGVEIHVDAETIEIRERPNSAPTPNSPEIKPVNITVLKTPNRKGTHMKIKTNLRAGQGGADSSAIDTSTSSQNQNGKTSSGGGGGGGGGGKVVYTRCAGY
ncbi:hypothetical protein [Sphingobium subterraneum]|uniref:Uncharacterized protein n=1 Tax=Sphingobium subterraneum TaxID=627688 RepID=A0A841J1H9_9SPHN|nr:hypothetical protein [Sphingobium subterraneum]MBB6125029.1 hypothetical protein [Sphingobium subterraneum]